MAEGAHRGVPVRCDARRDGTLADRLAATVPIPRVPLCAGKDADEFSVFTAAYRETQPTPIFAEPDEEEEEEEEGDGIRKYVPR